MSARPFVKWLGGKTRLIPTLLAKVPVGPIDTYYEPFVGGGALFFELKRLTNTAAGHPVKHWVISDANHELIDAYISIRDDVELVISILGTHDRSHSEEHYYWLRAHPASYPAARAARMIYLNKTCFNGVYRVNRAGGFNVPWGKHPTFTPDVDGLRAASEALQGVDIQYETWSGDFSKLILASGRDFIYCDPPYTPTSKTADFTQYTAARFGAKDHLALANQMRAWKRNGVRALLSNADTAETRALYEGLTVESVQAPRSVNSDVTKRKKVGELLVSTGNP